MLHNKRITIVILIIASLLGIFLFAPVDTALVFYEKNTRQLAAFKPIEIDDKFQIVFTHSIHLTDVVEKYTVTENLDIKQYEIVYEEFGIGMPANAGEGQTFIYEDGKYHVKDLDNYFDSMKIRNGKTVSENRFLWESNTGQEHMVWFNDYFDPGDWFTVKVEKITLWEYMRGVKIHE
ncbi:DUF1850 domain-containing protein [Oceanobacillus polygoni]|uniref:DUF1850 domain-containing protein n=1 Tax=Oceanobacillus polygoni TaxID=1235259 RepID=A0A9X0YPF5_9BACI|nr:DUF1850 domain-containing protein [Oceanobacillus polygoni]MBP2076309.1 hypothetical protein [Oceanobacillus polygoni]